MKILLLYPEFPDTFWSFKHALEVHPEEGRCSPTRSVDRGSDVASCVGKTIGRSQCAGPH